MTPSGPPATDLLTLYVQADIFLEHRSVQDVQRNAMISILYVLDPLPHGVLRSDSY